MNCNYSISNFRIFDTKGANFEFAPLTILTGCNSSGKSSLTKSLLVFDTFLRQMREGIEGSNCNPFDYSLNLASKDARLGRFDLVQNTRRRPIVFAYDIVSDVYPATLHVEYSFRSDKIDKRNHGTLNGIRVTDSEGHVVVDVENADNKILFKEINLYPLKPIFQSFCSYAIAKYLKGSIQAYEAMGPDSGTSPEEEARLEKQFEIHTSGLDISQVYLSHFKRYFDVQKNNPSIIYRISDQSQELEYISYLNSVFMLPALKQLLECSCKEDALACIDRFISVVKSDETVYFLNRIRKDFMSSTHDLFSDFYQELEDSLGLVFHDKGARLLGFSFEKKDFFSLFKTATKYSYNEYDTRSSVPESIKTFSDNGSLVNNVELKESIETEYKVWLETRDDQPYTFKDVFNTLNDVSMAIDEIFRDNAEYDMRVFAYSDIRSYTIFQDYVVSVLKAALVPDFTGRFIYHGSDKAQVKRLYSLNDSDATESFDSLIVRYMESIRKYKGKFIPGSFINDWVKAFRIGDSITFQNTAEGLGLMIVIHTTPKDKKGHLLADEGYGITQLLSVMIAVEVAVMEITGTNKHHKPTVIVEEPEIHLHPKYQSLLADMFIDAFSRYGVEFIVETHSEYLIRKIQTRIAQDNKKEKKEFPDRFVSLYYMYGSEDWKPGEPHHKKIEIREDGRLASSFGPGFFDEADNLAMELLSIKVSK